MKKLNTIKIKGKEYVMVKDRIMAFNEMYPKGSIVTEIIKNDEKSVVVKATACPDNKEIRLFTGHSEAYRNGNMGDVPVEVAETSAVGRCLGMLGIGILDSVASADEINKASFKEATITASSGRLATQKQKDYIQKMLVNKGLNFLTDKELETLTMDEASKLIEKYKFRPKHYAANDRDFTPDEESGDKYEAIREQNEIIINQE